MSVARGSAPFDLKSISLSGLALLLHTTDLDVLTKAMAERFGGTPEVFSHDAVVIDLSALPDDTAEVDFVPLAALLRSHRLLPAGVRGGSEPLMQAALEAGLGDVADVSPVSMPILQEQPAGAVADLLEAPPTAIPVATLIIDKPLRSGQQVYAKGGDLVVLATVNVGAEVIADGNIHVYGPLRGKAVAGAKGNTEARIFSTCMEPQLLAIAGTYRTTENPLPAEVLGKAAQIRFDGDRLVFEPLD